MKKILFGFLAIALLAAGAVFVVAEKGGHKGGHGPGEMHGHGQMMGLALRGLDLTDEQKAGVKGIMEASRANIDPLMQQMHDNRAKLAALGADGTFDQAQVEALAGEQGDVTAKLIVERAKVRSQIFALLTDAQKAKAAEMHAKFENKIKGRKGFGDKRHGSEF